MNRPLHFDDEGDSSDDELVCDGTRAVDLRSRAPSQDGGRGGSSDDEIAHPATIATLRLRRRRWKETRAEESGGGEGIDSAEASRCLELMLTDGRRTFRGRIRRDEVKGRHGGADGPAGDADSTRNGEDGGYDPNLASVRSYILTDDHPDIAVAFETVDERRIGVTIREKLPSGIVRLIWTGQLTEDSSRPLPPPGSLADPRGGGGALSFVSVLGASLRSALDEISRLREEVGSLRSDVRMWRDTASKLDETWQDEKDALMDRFLVLLNRVKGDLRDSRKELEEEKKKKKVAVEPVLHSVLDTLEKTPIRDTGEGHDYEIYDSDEVDRLAAGLPTAKKRSGIDVVRTGMGEDHDPSAGGESTCSGRSTELSDRRTGCRPDRIQVLAREERPLSQLSQENDDFGEDSQSSMRRNPLTGAVEMFGQPSEAMFEEDSQQSWDNNIASKRDNRSGERGKDGGAANVRRDRSIGIGEYGGGSTERDECALRRKRPRRAKPPLLSSGSSAEWGTGAEASKPSGKSRGRAVAGEPACKPTSKARAEKKSGSTKDFSWADKMFGD